MKIAVDARWIFPEISGVGAYTRELIRHLAALDHENAYLLLFDNAAVSIIVWALISPSSSACETAKILNTDPSS